MENTPEDTAPAKPRVRLHVPPEHTPEEEAALVAQVAAAIADSTGPDSAQVEVVKGEEVNVAGDVAHRMHQGTRWGS